MSKDTVSHFQILEPLGAGGMGRVYKAFDTKLKRTVALKFVSHQLSEEPEAQRRLLREARAAAALNHSNICTIHEVDEVHTDLKLETGEQIPAGTPFIAMEMIDGEPLDRVLSESGPLPLDEFLGMAVQMAEGLAEAHSQGIVHRDLKPQNIVVTSRGQVKILDFGLAKPLTPSVPADEATFTAPLTREGTLVGTTPYMSPEQVNGKPVDSRSDIFSFGVMLYEMLSGKRPFQGQTTTEILAKILEAEPTPLSESRSGLPEDLERIACRCLHKKPEQRYNDTRDLVAALADLQRETLSTRIAPSVPKRSRPWLVVGGIAIVIAAAIFVLTRVLRTEQPVDKRIMLAVLPFENLGAPEDEYFASGVTEEITARLAVVPGLGLISRNSITEYKNTQKTLQQIGEELGVDYLMKGTIRWERSSDETQLVRVTPHLIRIVDATEVWAQIYDEALTEIFKVQSTIANQVLEELGVILHGRDLDSVDRKPTENLDAYQAYLRGLDYARRIDTSPETWEMAEQMFSRAIELDSGFAAAYAELSLVHAAVYNASIDRSEARLETARLNAQKAIAIGPNLPESYLANGYYYYFGHGEYSRALVEFKIGERCSPNDYRTLEAIGVIYKRTGKFDKAIEYYTRAFELNPRDAGLPIELGIAYQLLRQYGPSEHYYDRAIGLAPDQRAAYRFKACLHLWGTGDIEKSRQILASAPPAADNYLWIATWISQECFERDFQGALAWVDVLSEVEAEDSLMVVYHRAMLYAAMGDKMGAAPNLEAAATLFQSRLEENPEQPWMHMFLADVYAQSGRKEQAAEHAKRATELWPISDHPLSGVSLLRKLAGVYVAVGQFDDAVELLERQLNIPSYTSVARLRLEPVWDPIRDFPAFQDLLEKYDTGNS